MARIALLLASLPLAISQFVPPEVILQAGYPAGFRAFIPDFPGCQQFAFHGKINNPFIEDNELGSIYQEILRPQDGFWVIQDFKLILTPGDIIHYWSNIVKDGVGYPKHNQTWKVPGPEGSVDILSPIKPPKENPPQKVKETKPTSTEKAPTTELKTSPTSTSETNPTSTSETSPTSTSETSPTSTSETSPTSTSETSPTSTTVTNPTSTSETSPTSTREASTLNQEDILNSTTVADNSTELPVTTDQTTPLLTHSTPSTVQSTPSTTTTKVSSTTIKSTPTTEVTTPATTPKVTTTTTTKKPATSEKRETANKKTNKNDSQEEEEEEEEEEVTKPAIKDSQLASEFPEESPLFPFPNLYPPPLQPIMPSRGPGFEICSNPWNFEERVGETRTQKLERQVAKLQCQLGLFQRGYNQLSNTVETELTDLKKLMYGMVGRMASLESVLRSTPFG